MYATVRVDYGGGRSALFTGQIMASAMSDGGDSGSAVFDAERRLVGLLFAGSEFATVLSPIQAVLDALGITARRVRI